MMTSHPVEAAYLHNSTASCSHPIMMSLNPGLMV